MNQRSDKLLYQMIQFDIIFIIFHNISIIAERSNRSTFTVVKIKPDGRRVCVC